MVSWACDESCATMVSAVSRSDKTMGWRTLARAGSDNTGTGLRHRLLSGHDQPWSAMHMQHPRKPVPTSHIQGTKPVGKEGQTRSAGVPPKSSQWVGSGRVG